MNRFILILTCIILLSSCESVVVWTIEDIFGLSCLGVEHGDDVIRLTVRMAKKDRAFTEEEAVKFYHEEMEE